MMSGSEFSLELSEEAYDDLTDIQSYTYREFGESHWKKYGEGLDKALKQILLHPFSGHKRLDIPEGYLCRSVAEHVIIYRIESLVIYVVRVLHKKMDFRFQL